MVTFLCECVSLEAESNEVLEVITETLNEQVE